MSWGLLGQQMGYGSNPALAQNMSGMSQAQAAAQLQQMYNQHIAAQPKWMINGRAMDFKDFVDTVFPEDTAEKTAFLLKYSGN